MKKNWIIEITGIDCYFEMNTIKNENYVWNKFLPCTIIKFSCHSNKTDLKLLSKNSTSWFFMQWILRNDA